MNREEFAIELSKMDGETDIDWNKAYDVMCALSNNHATETGISPWQVQLIVMMEELSELSCEVSKIIRCREDRNAVLEELADVLIMAKYLKMHMGYSDEELSRAIKVKLHRYDWVLGENSDR